jgi:hypothetical protein
VGVFSTTQNPLNGQHIRVIWVPTNIEKLTFGMQYEYYSKNIFNCLAQQRWSGNPEGLSGSLKGGLVYIKKVYLKKIGRKKKK